MYTTTEALLATDSLPPSSLHSHENYTGWNLRSVGHIVCIFVVGGGRYVSILQARNPYPLLVKLRSHYPISDLLPRGNSYINTDIYTYTERSIQTLQVLSPIPDFRSWQKQSVTSQN